MKEKNGFIMIETVVMASIISIFLISTFAFTSRTVKKYETRERYDQIDAVYNLSTIKMFLYRFTDLNKIIEDIKENGYININYNNLKFSEGFNDDEKIKIKKYFKSLLNYELNVGSIYITKYDFSEDIDNIAKNDIEFKDYLKTIDITKSDGSLEYRLIGKFKDTKDTNKFYYANIEIYNSNARNINNEEAIYEG